MGLFLLGIFVRTDVTLGLATGVSQARIDIIKKKAKLKEIKSKSKEEWKIKKKDIKSQMDCCKQQLVIYSERFRVLKNMYFDHHLCLFFPHWFYGVHCYHLLCPCTLLGGAGNDYNCSYTFFLFLRFMDLWKQVLLAVRMIF